MPIVIDKDIPAYKILTGEKIFVMDKSRADVQDIRPIEIAILNLMPTKETTETQFMRLLSNSPLQVNVTLVRTETYNPTHVEAAYLSRFYKNFDDIKSRKFDGMIITGAPVENLEFEDVAYWKELEEILNWTKSNVTSTLFICWGAQAGLYYHYGIEKYPLPEKLSGIFPHKKDRKTSILLRGFDDSFMIPHSRHTTVQRQDIEAVPELKILASGEEDRVGVFAVSNQGGSQIFITGHPEYDPDTLAYEYFRDVDKGLPINLPKHYFPGDDPAQPPIVQWRSAGQLFYTNWLNYYVYQTTPYDITQI